jgi:hypothetical protein
MSVKDRLHRLVDALPESEVPTAERILDALRATADPVAWALDNAPLDDEPDDDDFDGGLTEAREEMRAGKGIPHEEVKRMLGLD